MGRKTGDLDRATLPRECILAFRVAKTEHLTNVSNGKKAVLTNSLKVQSIIERSGAAVSSAAGRGGYFHI